MANYFEPSQEQLEIYRAWVSERPDCVRKVAEKFQPWKLYRMKSSGHRVIVVSFHEHKDAPTTLTVAVTGRFNFVVQERQVFGVDPNDLVECDLPATDEKLGSMDLTVEQVRELIHRIL